MIHRLISAVLAAGLLVFPPASSLAQQAPCPGDCDDSGEVTIDELVRGVNIALGLVTVGDCPSFDRNSDGIVTVDELVSAVLAALEGCPPAVDTPTASPTGSTPEPTDTATTAVTDTPEATPTATVPVSDTDTPTVESTPSATDPGTATPTGTPTPTSTEAPTVRCPVAGLVAELDGADIDLTWSSTNGIEPCDRFRLLRRLNAAPETANDPLAELIYDGPETAAQDSLDDLLPSFKTDERNYYYRVFACNGAICDPDGSSTTVSPTIPQLLRNGGYNIHWRHSAADICADRLELGTAATTTVPDWWRSCDSACGSTATARQLSDAGRAEATLLGNEMRSLGIPFGRVLSSEYCRNFSTAEFMNLGPQIELLPEITYFVYDEANRCQNTNDLVSESPAAGTNTALIGHAGFSPSCPIFGSLAWSEAAIMRPLGIEGSELIGRVLHTDWAGMAHARPLALTAFIESGSVRLSWTPPDVASGNTQVRIVRRLNAVPAGPNDSQATLVYEGPLSHAQEPLANLLPSTPTDSRNYFYTAYGCDDQGTCETSGSGTLVSPTLIEALQGGGYVLHFRHASATVCSDNLGLGTAANTISPNWWRSCDTECGTTATTRQLNDAGRMEAVALGTYFRSRSISFSRVLSSEYCRNFQTAELMDLGPLELLPAITYFVYDESNRCQNSYALIREVPEAGTNTALIGHAGFSGSCDVLGSLAWSEAAIFKPDGVGGQQLIARRLWNAWES